MVIFWSKNCLTVALPIRLRTNIQKVIKKNLLLFTAILTVSFAQFAHAQDQDQEQQTTIKPVTVQIEKTDRTILKGKLLGVEKDSALFRDINNQEYRISMKEIRNIDYVDTLRRSNKWYGSPNTIRYFLTPTGHTLKKKEIMLESTYIFITTCHYGLTDRVTIGGGGDLSSGSLFLMNAKVNILDKPKHKFSAGVNYYRFPQDSAFYDESIENIGMVYGASTWGNNDNHFTIGAGYMYIAKGFLPPILTASGTLRLFKHLALVTENWFFFVGERTGAPVLVSLGLRYISKRSTLDLAYYTDHTAIEKGAPYIAFAIKLGKIRS
jgi:hypothetical protein